MIAGYPERSPNRSETKSFIHPMAPDPWQRRALTGTRSTVWPKSGQPLVDSIAHSSARNLKELRPGSTGRSEVRVLFTFDPWRSAIPLTGCDKSGDWQGWHRRAIPHAEELYADYLKEREAEEGR
jgi:hypothetical protein